MTGEDAFPLKHAVRARSRDLIAASARLAKASDVAFLLTPTDEGFELAGDRCVQGPEVLKAVIT